MQLLGGMRRVISSLAAILYCNNIAGHHTLQKTIKAYLTFFANNFYLDLLEQLPVECTSHPHRLCDLAPAHMIYTNRGRSRRGEHKAIEAAKQARIIPESSHAKCVKIFDFHSNQEALSLHFSCKSPLGT